MKWISGAVLGAALCVSACSTTAELAPAPAATHAVQIVDASDQARIDGALRAAVERDGLAGASALIYENGQEVYFGAFGEADREAHRPMARDTIVQIFSMTKPITGVALMMLYEEGKFQLDDPLSQYLPEFANIRVYTGLDANGQPIYETPHRPITVRDITRHTAGFASNPSELPAGMMAQNPGRRENTLAQEAHELSQLPLVFHPGERWLYGPSVDVQARLVEVLSGMPFDRFVRTRILNPLRMDTTRYVVPEADRGRLAASYRRGADNVIARVPDEEAFAFNTRDWPLKPGSYGYTSTLDDYMRFARMLVNEGELDGVRVLRPETVRLLSTSHLDDSVTNRSWLPNKGQVGFGVDVAVRLRPPADAAESSGQVGEFFWDGAASTLFWVDPANDLTAVMFVQIQPFDPFHLHKSFRDAVYAGTSAAAPTAP
ncbi:MAG: serine hydrolase domain-containing protein [Terricaulis sp.]